MCRSLLLRLNDGFGDKKDGHFQGSLECTEESLELSTVRTLAERVLPNNGNECLQWDGVAEDDDVEDDSLAFTWDPRRALSTDGTWHDGSEDAGPFRHDEGGPDSFKISPAEGKSSVLSSASDETRPRKAPISSELRPGSARRRALVKESAAPVKESAGSVKERAAQREKTYFTVSISFSCSTSFSSSQREGILCLRLFRRCFDPALAYILVGSVETTDERVEVKVPSTAVMDMSGVRAGTSVFVVVVVLADNSPPTLRVEALSPSNGPTTLASLNLTVDEDIQFERTRTMDSCTNSVAGSGAGFEHAETADGSFADPPVTPENVLWRTLVVGLDQELHPNQTVYILINAIAALDSSGKPFVGLAGSEFNFAVAE